MGVSEIKEAPKMGGVPLWCLFKTLQKGGGSPKMADPHGYECSIRDPLVGIRDLVGMLLCPPLTFQVVPTRKSHGHMAVAQKHFSKMPLFDQTLRSNGFFSHFWDTPVPLPSAPGALGEELAELAENGGGHRASRRLRASSLTSQGKEYK